MKIAPPLLGPLEFFGFRSKLILVEHDEDDCGIGLLSIALSGKNNIIFSPCEPDKFEDKHHRYSVVVECSSIASIHRALKKFSGVKDFIVINRIDMLDIEMPKREKGAQTKAYVSMLASPKILLGANIIVMSCKNEYTLREIADRHISLRK